MPTSWQGKMDPADLVDFTAEFASGDDPVLEPGESIAAFDVRLSDEAAAAGLMIADDVDRAPRRINANQDILLWLKVDPAEQGNERFTDGVKVGVVFTITTSSDPARIRERTFLVTVKQL